MTYREDIQKLSDELQDCSPLEYLEALALNLRDRQEVVFDTKERFQTATYEGAMALYHMEISIAWLRLRSYCELLGDVAVPGPVMIR